MLPSSVLFKVDSLPLYSLEGGNTRRALALLTNILIAWKGLPRTNTPAYLSHVIPSGLYYKNIRMI